MKFIISESQFKYLQEQMPEYGGLYDPKGKKLKGGGEKIIKFRNKNPEVFDTVASIGLWYIPYIGPYLSVSYSGLQAIEKLKKGKYVEGIIELITSPLVILKTSKILKLLGGEKAAIKMLEIIHKSGLPVLISEGQEAFLKWGYKTFGKDFEKFIQLLKNEKELKSILVQTQK